MVLSLVLMWAVLFQTLAADIGGNLANDNELAHGAGFGLVVFFLYLLGGAFSLGLPRVSMVLFIAAAALGITGGATTAYSDLYVWGGVAAGLAVMSYFGVREKRRNQRRPVGQWA
jgi:hypothetical protein